LETVIVFPLILVVRFGALQVGLWFYARSVCLTAAEEATRAGSVYGGTTAEAYRAGQAIIDQAASGLVQQVQLVVGYEHDQITAQVTGQGLSLVPGWPIVIEQRARRPLERVR
jgi:hypothetical protein